MLKPDAIPIEVVETYLEAVEHGCGARDVLWRALSAWPGAYRMGDDIDRARLCLPVPTEPEEETSMDEYSAQVEGSYQQTRHP